nr:tRNA (N6-isopentenyl adenosine(37)-C2)-methylthiotransferase MiaB [Actinoplanes digitatis]
MTTETRGPAPDAGAARTYDVRTYGCQMNVHDSERISGLMEGAGYVRAADADAADVVVFNTCAVRENADNRLYGNLGHLRPTKLRNPGMQIAVGGCLAQKDRGDIVKRAPWVDVVFGTHNIGSLPALLERARHNQEAEVEILESLEVFPSTLPTRRESTYAGWVSISVGCNNTCTFCIVPSLRGKEKDRRPGDVLAEVEALVAEGVLEVTLLGQNVNSYGAEFGDRLAFGKLLRACGDVSGLERVRFTSPHPKDFTDDVIAAMAETPNVCHSLHMPLQSGSDRVLRAMRRSYRSEKYLGIIDKVRAAMPDAAITTDIIVGFPGETEDDFECTLDVVRQARFSSAFTFQYSKRPGTPAATMDDQLPKQVVQERYERLIATLEDITWAENKRQVGRAVEVLVATGEGRKDERTGRMSGRARDGRAGALRDRRADRHPAGRHRAHRDHVRGAAPPERRRRAAGPPPHPGRRRPRGGPGTAHGRRLAGPAERRRAGAAARRGRRLRSITSHVLEKVSRIGGPGRSGGLWLCVGMPRSPSPWWRGTWRSPPTCGRSRSWPSPSAPFPP